MAAPLKITPVESAYGVPIARRSQPLSNAENLRGSETDLNVWIFLVGCEIAVS